MGFDVSAAVPLLPRVFPPQGEHVSLAVETQLMCGLLALAWGSHGSRRLRVFDSASASASGMGSVLHGPNTGPPSAVGCRRAMGHRGPSSPNLTCCCWGLGGLPGLHVVRRAAERTPAKTNGDAETACEVPWSVSRKDLSPYP